MPPKAGGGGGGGGRTAEVVKTKSPSEFFAENQNIAGFDNPGKSLYTTVRELVENSLDAAESIQVLPDISITIEELTEAELNELRGVESRERVDLGLFQSKTTGKRKAGAVAAAVADAAVPGAYNNDEQSQATGGGGGDDAAATGSAAGAKGGKKKGAGSRSYYRVTCQDNGCGMPHDRIPDMLGRVLSGSKYGVRQTRGKFGLGSKMALIWSKKSTGLPIEIQSAHSTDASRAPSHFSRCILDIDIYRNQPQVKLHEKVPNEEKWRGTRIDVVVEGNWTTYKSHIMHYFQQLAIITPYAQMEFTFRALSNAARESVTRYVRRSDQMPPPAHEVKYHPSSVNHLIVQQLLSQTKAKTFLAFLATELACVTKPLAARIVKELGSDFEESMPPADVDQSMSIRLTSLLKSVSIFKPPDGSCLSPAGEYNLRLGIMKELHPDYVATVSEPAAAFEGHPFIVEAGVSLGGQAVKDGINVYRFANRIPLLFEAGNDVVTQVVNRRIHWQSYKIDPKKDRVGVFVSIVSTKIPFKGTGKEYIGDDIEEIRKCVKAAIQRCCKQLKQHLLTRNAERDVRERKKNLLRYTPDVARAVAAVLHSVHKRKRGMAGGAGDDDEEAAGLQPRDAKQAKLYEDLEKKWAAASTGIGGSAGAVVGKSLVEDAADMADFDRKLRAQLESAIEKVDLESALEAAIIEKKGGGQAAKEPLFVAPLDAAARLSSVLRHPVCGLRLLSNAVVLPAEQ